MVDELGRLGHSVSYGTLYLALHRMEEDGLLLITAEIAKR
jgi:DNA-binding PadR family transcriptional regulator